MVDVIVKHSKKDTLLLIFVKFFFVIFFKATLPLIFVKCCYNTLCSELKNQLKAFLLLFYSKMQKFGLVKQH